MNNSTIDDTAQKEIYIVQGNNWASEVELNEFNLQFDLETKYDEAATKVIERLKGFDNGLEINLFEGTEPELGGTVLVYLKNKDPEDGKYLMVYELLANAGFYKESVNVFILTEAALLQEELEKKLIEKLQNEKIKKPRKSRKKNSPTTHPTDESQNS